MFNVRVTPAEIDVWKRSARRQGLTLTEFVRRGLRAQARADSDSDVHSILEEHDRRLRRLESTIVDGAVGTEFPLTGEGGETVDLKSPLTPPPARAFERGCLDADLHEPGTVCSECGGSF